MSDRQQSIALGGRRLQARDYRGAAEVLEPLCADESTMDEAVQLLALAKSRLGEDAAAEALYRRYLDRFPRSAAVWNNFGNLKKRSDLSEALACYDRALQIRPEYPDALYNRALCEYNLHRYAQALETLDRLRSVASQPRELELRGVLLLALHQPAAARDSFQLLLQQRPDSEAGLLNLAIAQRRLGNRQAALALLQGRDSPALLRERCALLQETGEWEQSEKLLLRLLQLDPRDTGAHDMLDQLRFQMGRRGEVGASLHAAYEQTGDHRLLGQLALKLEKLGRSEAAAECLKNCPEALASDPDLRRLAGRLALRLEGAEASEDIFRHAEQHFPHHRELLLDYARLKICRDQLTQADRLLTTCLQLNPNDQEAWSYQGTSWKLAGDARYAWLCDYGEFVGEQHLLGEGLDAGWLAQLREYLAGLHQTSQAPMDQTLRNGTQTPGALFVDPSPLIRTLVQRLQVLVKRHIAALPRAPESNHPLLRRVSENVVFNGSWSVRLHRQGRHINHNHRDGWFSSALYIELPPGVGDDSSDQGCLQLGQSNFGLDPAVDRVERIIRPEEGKLALFPSYCWHGTVPFEADAARMSVAFDTIPEPGSGSA